MHVKKYFLEIDADLINMSINELNTTCTVTIHCAE